MSDHEIESLFRFFLLTAFISITGLSGCQNKANDLSKDYNERLELIQAFNSDDAKLSSVSEEDATSQRAVEGVEIEITSFPYGKIYRNEALQVQFKVVHPTDTWVVKGYFMGGQTKDNPTMTSQDGTLSIQHTFVRKTHYVTLIIRNITKCRTQLSEQQCYGKHSIRPISRLLETYFMVPVKTEEVPEEAPEIIEEPKEPYKITKEDYLSLLKTFQESACSAWDKKKFKLSIPVRDRLGLAAPDFVDAVKGVGEKNWAEMFINAGQAIDTATTTQSDEMKKTEQTIHDKFHQCLEDVKDLFESRDVEFIDE